ncbi:MAG TPA: chaperone modulator CbpM [Chitinophagaceae bacterium]|jgi:hypothetical protein|nr:chaperone modulator CbpM [Chitinophagaceae bacterium]
MEKQDLISTDELCAQYQVEYSFIDGLQEHGLLKITTIKETRCVPTDSLADLERFIRLHYEMDINLEGIEAINHLLHRVEEMQHQLNQVHNRLRLYEE